jgi:acetyl esterase/lipase
MAGGSGEGAVTGTIGVRTETEVLSTPGAPPDAVVRYGDHPDQLLDVHLPPVPGKPAPVVFLVHGGFWRQEYDRVHTRPMAQALAARGWAVVTPEYRRTGGDGGWPATFDDKADALAHVSRLADVAPDRLAPEEVTLLGHSAGGHLALWLATRPRRPTTPRLRRVVALAPVADLRAAHEHDLGDGAVADLMGGAPHERPDAYAAADPAALLSGAGTGGAGVEVVVLHGEEDDQVPLHLSRDLPGVRHVALPGVDHYAPIDPLSAAWPHVLAALED